MGPASRPLGAIAAACLVVGLGACGGSSSKNSNQPGNAGAVETIKNFSFSPAMLTVAGGTTVTVHNTDDTAHTVTADAPGFDTGPIAGGGTATFVAPKGRGRVSYHCAIHTYMHGTIVVR